MGKFISTKHSNINRKILKKSYRNIGGNKNAGASDHFSSELPLKVKHKLKNINTTEEPDHKKLKIESNIAIDSIDGCNQKQVQDLYVEIHRNQNTRHVELRIENEDSDLCSADDLKASYIDSLHVDWLFHLFDEIALEGLDGITIEGLWKRLNVILYSPLCFHHIKSIIWKIVKLNKKIGFYELPRDRAKLNIYNRFSDVDQEIGVISELFTALPDIYPIEISKDNKGSCPYYSARVDITDKLTKCCLQEVDNIYGRKFVMVADNNLRKNALYHETSDPLYETQPVEYCILERIGRSRQLGEVTQGNMSLTTAFKMDSKSLYHYKKHLMHNNLLAKQFFYIRSSLTEQNKCGRLLHLKRFFNQKKSKNLLITEKLINLLKKKIHFRVDLTELKNSLPAFRNNMKKLLKMSEVQKYIKIIGNVPYRQIYPKALKSEWQLKNKGERAIKVLELKDPYVNVSACWNDINSNGNDDSDEEDMDNEENSVIGFKSINKESIKEIYLYILSKKSEGSSMTEIINHFEIEKLMARSVLKRLKTRNFIDIKKVDRGRQRLDIFIAKCILDNRYDALDTSNSSPENKYIGVLEKLKKRQNQYINKHCNRTVYTREIFEQEKGKYLLNDKSEVLPTAVTVPKLVCNYFITYNEELKMNFKENILESCNSIKIKPELFSFNMSFNRLFIDIAHFDIFVVLQEINSLSILMYPVKSCENFKSSKSTTDNLVKLFLLKILFNDTNRGKLKLLDEHHVVENIKTVKLETNIDQNTNKYSFFEKSISKYEKNKEKLNYMGTNPIVVLDETDESGIVTKIFQSSLLQAPNYQEDKLVYEFNPAKLTDRVIERLNIILKTLRESEILEDIHRFVKIINEAEKKDGYNKNIDRKSLFRLFYKLVSEGYVKIYRVIIQDVKITKHQTFMCKPTIDHTHSLIKSACEQIKWKFFVGTAKRNVKPTVGVMQQDSVASTSGSSKRKTKSPFLQTDVAASISELKELNKSRDLSYKTKYNRVIGKMYGFRPKCVRMRVLHEFLYYIIYEFRRDQSRLSNTEVTALFKRYNIILSEENLAELPPIYCKEISWKMFIPPLPKHKGWQEGWALLCDVILRMPLSVLVKINNVPFEERELMDALQHPVKKYYLMKNHTEPIRNVVLCKRKYMFNIHEILCRLAYCGLVQFGPEKYKEKDQSFVYLNKVASLLDTTSSAPGYHKVSDKEYPKLEFIFTSFNDVEKYWYHLYNISMNTKLNARDIMVGKTITLFDIKSKPTLMSSLGCKSSEEAVTLDVGIIPGDRRGAGGLDSAMWTHLQRNWFWLKKSENRLSQMGLNQDKYRINTKNVMPYEELNHFISPSTNKVYLPKSSNNDTAKPLKSRTHMGSSKRKIEHRLIIKKKSKTTKRQYFDEVDKAILRKMGVQHRVRWTDFEDKIIILCRLVSVFLNPRNTGKQIIPFDVLRDILHRVVPQVSKNKTSRACQRRIKMLMRTDPNCLKLEENASNLIKCEPISQYFSTLINQIVQGADDHSKGFKPTERQLIKAFLVMMSYCVPHRLEIEQMLQGYLLINDHLRKDNLKHTEDNIVYECDHSESNYSLVKCEEDLKKEMFKSVLHSSLGNRNDYPAWAYHLFRIYEGFSDELIRKTVLEMKEQQFIAVRKKMPKNNQSKGHIPFDLSNYYVYSQGTTFNEKTAIETYKTLNTLLKQHQQDEHFLVFIPEILNEKKYGQLLAINELATFWENQFELKIALPDQPIVLDPMIQDHSEVVDELAKRYRLKLRKGVDEYENRTKSTSEAEFFSHSCSEEPPEIKDQDKTILLDSDTIEDSKTIKSLQSWLNDCMVAGRVRSPSPEFFKSQDEGQELEQIAKTHSIKTDLSFMREQDPVKEKDVVVALPSLEEIKEGMLKESATEKRDIPYITDLINLLSDNYTELDSDKNKLDQLKKHFIPQYSYLEEFRTDLDSFKNSDFFVDIIENNEKFNSVFSRVNREIIIQNPVDLSVLLERLRKEGYSGEYISLLVSVLEYIKNKNILGAKGTELKKTFLSLSDVNTLQNVITTLTQSHIILQAGVCEISFIHHSFRESWIIKTFHLSNDAQHELDKKSDEGYSVIKEEIQKILRTSEHLQIKVYPWAKLDGTINPLLLKSWLSKILSHCMDSPRTSMQNVCDKFCFVKPVDIYYLLEILADIGCVHILTEEYAMDDLWSDWQFKNPCTASFLDDFQHMHIEVSSVGMTCIGSFFTKILHSNNY